jgi:hypothetical protein
MLRHSQLLFLVFFSRVWVLPAPFQLLPDLLYVEPVAAVAVIVTLLQEMGGVAADMQVFTVLTTHRLVALILAAVAAVVMVVWVDITNGSLSQVTLAVPVL